MNQRGLEAIDKIKLVYAIIGAVLIATICITAAWLGELRSKEDYNYTLADFCFEDGSISWHTGPRYITADEMKQHLGYSYKEEREAVAEIVSALETGKRIPDNETVFTFYGFRAYGGPLVYDEEEPASGSIIFIIDDGQTEQQWDVLFNQIRKDAEKFCRQGVYWTSMDGQTEITIASGPNKRTDFILFDYE